MPGNEPSSAGAAPSSICDGPQGSKRQRLQWRVKRNQRTEDNTTDGRVGYQQNPMEWWGPREIASKVFVTNKAASSDGKKCQFQLFQPVFFTFSNTTLGLYCWGLIMQNQSSHQTEFVPQQIWRHSQHIWCLGVVALCHSMREKMQANTSQAWVQWILHVLMLQCKLHLGSSDDLVVYLSLWLTVTNLAVICHVLMAVVFDKIVICCIVLFNYVLPSTISYVICAETCRVREIAKKPTVKCVINYMHVNQYLRCPA